jgi:negative regulator of flagellin synthesis FlgM
MKIDQKVIFLKPGADASAAASVKETVSANRSTAEAPAAGAARPSSPTLLLPSTHGDFDAARVASIRDDISAGRYQINAAKIADGLLASVHELLNQKPS